VASEIRAVVAMALQQGACNAALLARCGFEIQEVRVYAVCVGMCVCSCLSPIKFVHDGASSHGFPSVV
jgi:hypothetical protein